MTQAQKRQIAEKTFLTKSPEETFRWGETLGRHLVPPVFIGLSGSLGTGKTLMAKAIASGMGHDPHEVHSPTFTIMNIYEGEKRLYHFDFYRLDSQKDFEGLGLEEFFYDEHAVVMAEWPEKVRDLMPENALMIRLEFGKSETERIVTFQALGRETQKLFRKIIHESSGV